MIRYTHIYSVLGILKIFGIISILNILLLSLLANASSYSNYILLDGDFSSTQTDGETDSIISESGLEDIQYISEGRDQTIYFTEISTSTSTPTPTVVSVSSSSGGGGSNQIVINQLSGKDTSRTSSGENENSEGEIQYTSGSQTNEGNTEIEDNLENLNIKQVDYLGNYHDLHSGINENHIVGFENNKRNITDYTTQDIEGKNISDAPNNNILGNILADDYFFRGNIHEREKGEIKKIIGENIINNVDTGDPRFRTEEFHSAAKIIDTNKKNENEANFFCETSQFNMYALLLIIFLLGMIAQLILHKIFYTNKNDI